MLGIRFFVLFAAFGILASDALTARAFAQAAATSSVPLPTARPGTKDTKSAGKPDTKSAAKPDNKTDSKTSSKSVAPSAAKAGTKKSAAAATKLVTEKSGAHKPAPPIRGSLATGSTPAVPVSALPGNLALRPAIPQAPVLPMAVAPTASTAPMDITAVKQAIDLVAKNRTDDATNIEGTISDPLARKLVEWVILRSDNGATDFSRYINFIAANPSWPSIVLVAPPRRRRAVGRARRPADGDRLLPLRTAAHRQRTFRAGAGADVARRQRRRRGDAARDLAQRWLLGGS